MSLRLKIIAGYLLIALLSGLVGFLTLTSVTSIDSSFTTLREVTLPSNQIVQQMQLHGESLLRAASELAFAYSIDSNQIEVETKTTELNAATQRLTDSMNHYLELADANNPELTSTLQTSVTGVTTASTNLLAAVQRNASLEEMDEVQDALLTSEAAFIETTNNAISSQTNELTTETLAINAEIDRATGIVVVLRIGAILIALAIGLFFSGAITKPIRALTETAQQMTAGDYNQQATVTSKDEIGTLANAFNTMSKAVQQREEALTELNQSLEQQVTQRTQDLAHRESQYRLLAENASDMVAQTDTNMKFVFISPSVTSVLGYQPDELIGEAVASLVHPDDVPIFAGDPASTNPTVVVRMRHKKNHYIWTESTFKIVTDPQNHNALGIVAVTRDITERKRLETDLEQQRLFLRRVIDFTPSMVFVKDYDGKFVLVNRKLAEIYHVTETELIGKSDSDFNPNSEEIEAFLKADQQVIESGEALFIPEEAVTNDQGDTRWFQTTKVPIVSVDGEVQQVLGLSTDITERKRIEAEREQLIQDLQISKRVAEENSRLKSDFLATMSHEIRTPLNAIEGFTSIMLIGMGGAQFNEKAKSYLERISANSKRLLSLVNDFLDLSRIESGRYELAAQPFSPAALAKRWQEEIGVLAEKKGLDFDLILDSHLPEKIYGDEEAISKIILNLLSNAMKFTEQGKIALHVANGGDNWSITVTDTGIGIPPHAREYIFDEFRQVDQSSRRKYGGTGLGLAIVQKLTRFMGGNITLTSELGQGSSFTVSLPIKITA